MNGCGGRRDAQTLTEITRALGWIAVVRPRTVWSAKERAFASLGGLPGPVLGVVLVACLPLRPPFPSLHPYRPSPSFHFPPSSSFYTATTLISSSPYTSTTTIHKRAAYGTPVCCVPATYSWYPPQPLSLDLSLRTRILVAGHTTTHLLLVVSLILCILQLAKHL